VRAGARRRIGGLRAAALAAAAFLAGCSEPAEPAATAERGRGPLVSPYAEITACETAVYAGRATPLYSDRPYHTETDVAPALGLMFCRSERHGTHVWTLEIQRPTTLVVFGRDGDGLDARGWTPLDTPLAVRAAGRALDRVYTRAFDAGRFVIRQGFHPTAPIVLWDADAARIAP